MKWILLFFLIAQKQELFCQNFTYPSIPKNGNKIEDFVPSKWAITNYVLGDLNNNSQTDCAMVLEYLDSTKVNKITNEIDTLYQMPRILVILLWDSISNTYHLAGQSNSFIINSNNTGLQDPYDGIIIKNNILTVRFKLFYNYGSWYLTTTSYKFRLKNGEFQLIGADNYSFHRSTLDFEEYSYNFLTKRWSFKKGNSNEYEKARPKWFKLDLKTLKTFLEPYTWEITKNLFL